MHNELVQELTETVSEATTDERKPVDRVCDVVSEGLHWHFADAAQAETLRVAERDWRRPADFADAELIKENVLRQVWRVRVNNKFYYVKLYLRNGLWWQLKRWLRGPTCEKEWRVARYARERAINCVRSVAYATSTDPEHEVDSLLITEGLDNTVQLTEYWQRLLNNGNGQHAQAIARLEDSLGELLARAHHAGIAHSDLHPGNLLVETTGDDVTTRPRVFLVDLHSVRIGRSVPDRVAIHNLAQLNQWFRQNATLAQRMRLLKRYMAHRQALSGDAAGVWQRSTFKYWAQLLDRMARRHARRLWASRTRRAMRTNKYFSRLKLGNHWRAHVFLQAKHDWPSSEVCGLRFNAEDWRETLASPEAMVYSLMKQGRPIKNSRSALVCKGRLRVGDHELDVVCKRHIRRKPMAAIWDCLRYSRCLRAWRVSYAMLHRGLPVAQPVAVLERRVGLYLTDNLLITEEIKPCVNVRLFLTTVLPVLEARHARRVKLVLIEQLSRLLRRMHTLDFVHRDMKATNVLIQGASVSDRHVDVDNLQLVLVDLDGLKLKRHTRRKDQLRALARLSFSADLSPHVTLTDRARFLKAYLTTYGSRQTDWRSLWYEIQAERETRFADHLAG